MSKFLTTKQVNRLSSAIRENKGNAELSQAIAPMVLAIINKNFYFTNSARNLGNQGLSFESMKFSYETRQGWNTLPVSKDNYDFLGLQGLGYLTEQVLEGIKISSKFQYDLRELSNIAGVDSLDSKVISLIETELPDLIEENLIKMVYDALENGITETFIDAGGNTTTDTATAKKYILNFGTDQEIQDSIFTIKKVMNRIQKIDNPLIKHPRGSDYLMFMDPEYQAYFERDIAYNVSGGDTPSTAWNGKLPIGNFAGVDGPLVITHPKMRNHTPIILIKKLSYYYNLGTPLARIAPIGTSPSLMFFSMDIPYRYKMSYWNMKFDGLFYFSLGSNTTSNDGINLSTINANMTTTINNATNGNLQKRIVVKGGADGQVLKLELRDNFGYLVNTQDITLDANGEDDSVVSYTNLPSWTYRTELYDALGNTIELTNYEQVNNKTYFALSITNEAISNISVSTSKHTSTSNKTKTSKISDKEIQLEKALAEANKLLEEKDNELKAIEEEQLKQMELQEAKALAEKLLEQEKATNTPTK